MELVPYQHSEVPVGSHYGGGIVKNIEYRVVQGAGPHSIGHATATPTTSTPPFQVAHPHAPTTDYPVDVVEPPFNHVPTGDGFLSPYETIPQNLNRNPFYKSWYDVPLELRQTPKPPTDFVISQHDPDFQYLQRASRDTDAIISRPAGISKFRFRIYGQRQEELKDNGPAIQMAEFRVYDMENQPYPMHQFAITCLSEGFCDEGCEPDKLIDGEPGTKFLRRDFGKYPVDVEIDFGQPILIGSYSWHTANDTPSRDPVSWQLQALVKGQWIVVDEVQECSVPRTRYAQVGPFGLANVPYENVVATEQYNLEPPMHVPLYQFEDDHQPDHYLLGKGPARSYPALHGSTRGPFAPNDSVGAPGHANLSTGNAPPGVNPKATILLHDILVQPSIDRLPARVQELLRKGADAVSPDTKGRTPLIKACRKGDPSVLTLLIDGGADVNARTHAGETALHRLALNGDAQGLETVLRAGADPNIQDGQGDTPLALATARADPACVALLLRAGARADLRNYKGLSGLDMLQEEIRRQGFETAAAREVRRLLGHGAGPNIASPTYHH